MSSDTKQARERIKDFVALVAYLAEREARHLDHLLAQHPEEDYLIWHTSLNAAMLKDMPDQLLQLLPLLTREFKSPRAPRKSRRMTPELRKTLAAEKLANPDVPMREIGQRHGVDGGRVSESMPSLEKRLPKLVDWATDRNDEPQH